MRSGWLAYLLLLPSLVASALPANELCLSDARGLKITDARLFEGVGSYRAPRVSDHPEAQRYFEQGLVFGWGFNFAESARSFRAATLRDPDCAMCRWGIAWAVGPSINHDMDAADMPIARDAIVQARAYATDPRTRELVAALALRYADGAATVADADAVRYAEALVALAERRSNDADIAVLAAEALMTAHAYDWWRADGTAQPWTPRIAALLDRALALAPDHPGAHHYRIHLYDESRTPAAALASAERLPAIAPGVGHLVHMPSHVYLRLGRYHDAVGSNQAAVTADQRYATATIADRAYAAGYALHNQHFLWASALWSGESQVALDTAKAMAATVASWPDLQIDAGTRQHLLATPLVHPGALWPLERHPPRHDGSQGGTVPAGRDRVCPRHGLRASGHAGACRAGIDSASGRASAGQRAEAHDQADQSCRRPAGRGRSVAARRHRCCARVTCRGRAARKDRRCA